MFRQQIGLLLCIIFGLAGPVLAEREIHVLAVGQGHLTDNYYALREARVLVDRPGQEVALVLLDDGDLHWKIEATPRTTIGEIVRSGPGLTDSKVTLYGIPMAGVQVAGLPLVFRPSGREFRTLVNEVTEIMDTEHISSFRGVYIATDVPLRVDQVDMASLALSRDYLTQFLGPSDDLPEEIRHWKETVGEESQFSVDFDDNGINFSGPEGTRRFAVTADVPKVLLPAAAVYDPGSQTIYCITYGAEGYLYSVDVQTGAWTVVTSLNQYDASGLLYDPESRSLITTGAFSRPGEIKVFGLDGSRSSIFVPTTAFPGLTDLFDYGNEHGPPLTPYIFADGWLLLEAVAGGVSAQLDAVERRIYAVKVATGDVRLLHFGMD